MANFNKLSAGIGSGEGMSNYKQSFARQFAGGREGLDSIKRQMDDAVKTKKIEQVKKELKTEPTSKPSTGSQLAGLASGMVDSSSSGGAGLQSGLQAAAMTSNPFIIGGAALMGILGANQKRKAARREGLAKAQMGREQAMSTARSNFATSMQNILTSRRY